MGRCQQRLKDENWMKLKKELSLISQLWLQTTKRAQELERWMTEKKGEA